MHWIDQDDFRLGVVILQYHAQGAKYSDSSHGVMTHSLDCHENDWPQAFVEERRIIIKQFSLLIVALSLSLFFSYDVFL